MIPIWMALCLVGLCVAKTPASPQQAGFSSWTTKELYDNGIRRLKQGEHYQEAITSLSLVVERDPKNRDYQLALGCAYASRYASLAYALSKAEIFESEQYRYRKRLTAWEKTHTNPQSPLFQTPAPPPPLPPQTPDDGKLFTMPAEACRRQMADLSRRGRAAFHAAQLLNVERRAENALEADYLRGWGLLLFYRYRETALTTAKLDEQTAFRLPAPLSIADREALSQPLQEIVDCFRACTEYAPQKSAYWQSLAVALLPFCLDEGQLTGLYAGNLPKENRIPEAMRALANARRLKPKNTELHYQQALFAQYGQPLEAIEALEKLAKTENDPVISLMLGERKLRLAGTGNSQEAETLRTQAFQALEKGCSAQPLHSLTVHFPVPNLLRAAWDQRPLYALGALHKIAGSLFDLLNDLGKDYLARKESARLGKLIPAMLEVSLPFMNAYRGEKENLSQMGMLSHLSATAMNGYCLFLRAYEFAEKCEGLLPGSVDTTSLERLRVLRPILMEWDRSVW